jgi:hypothetical protein
VVLRVLCGVNQRIQTGISPGAIRLRGGDLVLITGDLCSGCCFAIRNDTNQPVCGT